MKYPEMKIFSPQRFNHIQQASRRISIDKLLSDWRVISEKLPKGFEKYFQSKEKSGNSSDASKTSAGSTTNDKSSDAQRTNTDKSAETPPKSASDWSFGMFSPSNTKNSSGGRSSGSGGGGSGKPIGGEDNDKEKWLMFGAVSALAIAGAVIYFEVGYKEIGWKEFVNK